MVIFVLTNLLNSSLNLLLVIIKCLFKKKETFPPGGPRSSGRSSSVSARVRVRVKGGHFDPVVAIQIDIGNVLLFLLQEKGKGPLVLIYVLFLVL